MTKRVRWCLVAVAVFVALATWLLWPASEKPYHDLVARYRATGVAVEYDDLRGPPVPPEENGAADLQAALAWLAANMPSENEWKAPGPWNASRDADWQDHATPADWAELADLAAKLDPFLRLVEKAAAKPAIEFLDDPRDVFGFADGAHIRTLQRIQRVVFASAAGARDEARRLDAIACEAALAGRLSCTTVIDHMVAMAIGAESTRRTRSEIESGRLDAATARARLDPLLRTQWLARVPRILGAERVYLLQAYRTVLEGTFPWPKRKWYERVWDNITRRGTLSSSFDEIGRGMALPIVAFSERLREAEAVPLRHGPDYAKEIQRLVGDTRSAGPVGDFVPQLLTLLTRTDAQQRLARVALAAAEHRATHGDFPASLDELKPMFPDGLPLDPYTDAPFVYARTASGARIASLGRLPEETPLDDATLRERVLVWEVKR